MDASDLDPFALVALRCEQIPAAADLLADAFLQDAFGVHLFPVEETRRKAYRVLYRTILRIRISTGSVYATSERLEGLIVLDRPFMAGWRLRPTPLICAAASTLTLPFRLARVVRLTDLIRRFRKLAVPFRHLRTTLRRSRGSSPHVGIDLVAVQTDQRGRGWMGRMMRATLESAGQEGLVVVLETENPTNVPIYEHYGFHKVAHIEFLSGGFTSTVLSWRSPDLSGAPTPPGMATTTPRT